MLNAHSTTLFELANLEGEALTLQALISTDAHDGASISERVALVSVNAQFLWSMGRIRRGLAAEILMSIAKAMLAVSPACWNANFHGNLLEIGNDKSNGQIVEGLPGLDDLDPCETAGDYANNREGPKCYGGQIPFGDSLDESVFSCTCPDCGKMAKQISYERAEGSINTYQRIKCSECGYFDDTGEE